MGNTWWKWRNAYMNGVCFNIATCTKTEYKEKVGDGVPHITNLPPPPTRALAKSVFWNYIALIWCLIWHDLVLQAAFANSWFHISIWTQYAYIQKEIGSNQEKCKGYEQIMMLIRQCTGLLRRLWLTRTWSQIEENHRNRQSLGQLQSKWQVPMMLWIHFWIYCC